MDSVTQAVCRTSTRVLSDPVRLVQKPTLTNILNNIETLRRFCFRPKPNQGQTEECRKTPVSCVEENRLRLLADRRSAAGVLTGDSPVFCHGIIHISILFAYGHVSFISHLTLCLGLLDPRDFSLLLVIISHLSGGSHYCQQVKLINSTHSTHFFNTLYLCNNRGHH